MNFLHSTSFHLWIIGGLLAALVLQLTVTLTFHFHRRTVDVTDVHDIAEAHRYADDKLRCKATLTVTFPLPGRLMGWLVIRYYRMRGTL